MYKFLALLFGILAIAWMVMWTAYWISGDIRTDILAAGLASLALSDVYKIKAQ